MNCSKIPAVTIWFWLIRVMIAGAGVAWPDYVYQHLGQVLASGLICLALIVALAAEEAALRVPELAGFGPHLLATAVLPVAG